MQVWGLRCLLWFICVLFTAPQNRFPFLAPFHIADLCVAGAVIFHVLGCGQGGGSLLRLGPATQMTLALVFFGLVSQYAGEYMTDTSWNGFIDILIKSSIVALLVEANCTSVRRVWIIQLTLLLATLWWVKGGLRLSMSGATYGGDRIMGPTVGMVENPNGFAYMMCLIIPTQLFFFQQFTQKYMKWVSLALGLSSVYIVLETGSRTGMLCLIMVGVFLLPKYGARHKVALVISGVVIFIFSSSVGALNIQRFKSIPDAIVNFLSGVENEEKSVEEMDQDEQSAHERKMKNKHSWGLIKEHLLFGVGMAPDESKFGDRWPMATGQVHCEILMAGKQMGLIGMGLHVGLLGTLFILGWRTQRYFKGWWPAASDLGWTFKLQAGVLMLGGSFSPLPWHAPMMILCASCSALWSLRHLHPRPPGYM